MNNNYLRSLVVVLAVVVIGAGIYFLMPAQKLAAPGSTTTPPFSTTTSPVSPISPTSPGEVKGTVVMHLFQNTTISGATFTPWAVLEDSRCPSDVQCILAGRVRVALNFKSSTESAAAVELQPGQSTTTENFKIILLEVNPNPVSGHKIQDNEYQFVFNIQPLNPSISSPSHPRAIGSGGCFAGGCSGQICTDNPKAVSTCEYSPSYACYKNAACERQANGQCGWTETPALKACLASGGAQTQ